MSDDQEPTTRSFRPGEWFGIFGEHATVLLPPTEKARVAALWELVDEGAGFDETLDALIATGLRDLPGFVLVSEGEGVTRVVLRGAARASFTAGGETVDLDGSEAGTWVERSLHEVTRTSIEVAEESGTADLRVTAGLVRLSRVDQPPRTPGVETGSAEPLSAGPVVPEPLVEEPVVDEQPAPEPEPEFDGEATQAVPYLAGEPFLEEEADSQEPAEDEYADEEPPIWVPLPPEPPAPPAPPAPPRPGAPGVPAPGRAGRRGPRRHDAVRVLGPGPVRPPAAGHPRPAPGAERDRPTGRAAAVLQR